ncbi:UvrD-helicase domain-containing protein [Pseudomonas syringae pv. actinidiae]|uniref:UvrD-helicase domain-containing protein n=1 Tax=Pseudomonas syringae TaxID=317 RepID=UPI000A22BED1|nr:UvrD-helicase domain-containing protein [Pseudomonas syringae]MDU8614183.1 UvrD-helicase domain-containing protein [Pseudomonas syringae pv. actinidiae]OSN82461.1 putative ATP-dependent DNA helicase YjcD [Pseudomonas syringae pv. actinidiae]
MDVPTPNPSLSRPSGTPDHHLNKPWMHRLLDRLLDRWGVEQASAWRKGRELGWREGRSSGEKLGYERGLEDGKHVVELRPGPTSEFGAPGIKEPSLFKDWTLQLTPEIIQRFRDDVRRHLPKQQPSKDQWKMILSTTPTTSVVAGAGSGKSTTMVLRLLLLHHYLGVHFSSLTVVTFTKESKHDFAGKVRKVFGLWGHDISEDASLDIVRTFHSRILAFTRSIKGLQNVQAFEFLDNKSDEDEKAGSMLNVTLKAEQLDLMNQCYHELYGSHALFKDLIGDLVRRSVVLERLNKDHPEVLDRKDKARSMAQLDSTLCQTVEELWRNAGQWPILGVDPVGKDISILGETFHANGYIPQLGAYVLLGVDSNEPFDLKVPGQRSFLRTNAKDKRILFQAFCSQPVIVLNHYGEAAGSIDAIKNLATTCPKFRYKVAGELSSQAIMDTFYSSASFIENLGLDVVDAVKSMQLLRDDPDRNFFMALSIFWNRFQDMLKEMNPPVMTFNGMFAMFSERGKVNLEAVPNHVLLPMTTLLIDEFQDVGANTISWVRATFAEIERRNMIVSTDGPPAYASLMAVGDDWQSIYGWRGSSPQFFIDFDKQFVSPAKTRVTLGENHRSHQWVIDAAEAIVKRTGGFSNKGGFAVNPGVVNDKVPVKVLPPDYAHMRQEVRRHYEQGDTILILSRKRKDKEDIERHISQLSRKASSEGREDDIKVLTYHASKGLQADAVFLIGDCEVISSSPYKNDLYRQAKMGTVGDPCGFDTSQRHEALRTAYVAITRAIKSCYWYVDRKEAKTKALEKASRYIDESADFWDVDPKASLRVINAPVVKKFGAKPWSGSKLRR